MSRKLQTQRSQSLEELFIREGLMLSSQMTGYSASDPAANSILFTDYPINACPPPFSFFIKSIQIYSNKNIIVRIQSDNNSFPFAGANGYEKLDLRVLIPKNQTLIIPLNFMPPQSTSIAVRFVEQLDTTDAGTLKVGGCFLGWEVTTDTDWTAPKVIMAVGDSITRGTGATNVGGLQDAYTQRVKKWLADRGTRCRLVNKGVSGLTQKGALSGTTWGFYNIDQCDLILYNLGVNDASATFGTTEQTDFRTSVDSWINYKKSRYPDAKMIVLGPTPLLNTTNEAKNATVRTILQAAVTAASDPKITYCSLATAFDGTVSANYLDGVHPVKQAEIAAVITSHITANNITI